MKLYVGIDVSSEKLDVCFLDSEVTILKECTLPNDLPGAARLKGYIQDLAQKTAYARVVAGMESTSVYSFHPATFLAEDPELKALGLEVVVINPRSIHRFSGIFDEDKTDPIDAFHIADFLRFERYSTTLLKEEKYIALQRLTRSRYQLIQQMTECKQHFLENLYYKCNTLTKEVDTSVFGAAMMELLTESFTLDDISAMDVEELADFLQQRGRGRFGDPLKLAKAIAKATRDSYRLGKVMQESVDVVLATYALMIKTLKEQVKSLEKAIKEVLQTIPDSQCLLSIPGIGPVYTAGILAEIGQIQRFENEAKVAKYAGFHWKRNQSGAYESERTSLTRTGNHYLRYNLVEAANSVIRYEPVYREYYLRKYHEVPKHQHKRALVLTARKLVRMVDVLLRNHQLYAPERSV